MYWRWIRIIRPQSLEDKYDKNATWKLIEACSALRRLLLLKSRQNCADTVYWMTWVDMKPRAEHEEAVHFHWMSNICKRNLHRSWVKSLFKAQTNKDFWFLQSIFIYLMWQRFRLNPVSWKRSAIYFYCFTWSSSRSHTVHDITAL